MAIIIRGQDWGKGRVDSPYLIFCETGCLVCGFPAASHFVSASPSLRAWHLCLTNAREGSKEARLAGHEARQESEVYRRPSENPAPSAVLLSLESVRCALLTLNRSWLSVAARRLRAILAEVDAILALPEHDEF